mmetsp:Transcript_14339/g.39200  ORF Transcript_14339/g.39200 Transcript_14339/m.39200 type:complete len:228 (-) Transcript_14339:264-947(-)
MWTLLSPVVLGMETISLVTPSISSICTPKDNSSQNPSASNNRTGITCRSPCSRSPTTWSPKPTRCSRMTPSSTSTTRRRCTWPCWTCRSWGCPPPAAMAALSSWWWALAAAPSCVHPWRPRSVQRLPFSFMPWTRTPTPSSPSATCGSRRAGWTASRWCTWTCATSTPRSRPTFSSASCLALSATMRFRPSASTARSGSSRRAPASRCPCRTRRTSRPSARRSFTRR